VGSSGSRARWPDLTQSLQPAGPAVACSVAPAGSLTSPSLGGSVVAIPFAASRPKSSRVTRGGCAGNPTPRIVVTTAFTGSGATALPSARHGYRPASGTTTLPVPRPRPTCPTPPHEV